MVISIIYTQGYNNPVNTELVKRELTRLPRHKIFSFTIPSKDFKGI